MPGKKEKPKSKSKSQRRLMGWAYACKKGKTDNCPPNIQKLGDKMKASDLESMAKTKEKGKPEKVKSKKESNILKFNEFILENNSTRSEISEEEFIKIFESDCKLYRHVYSEEYPDRPQLLLRATKYKSDITLFKKPSTPRNIRLSAIITTIINKLPSWSKYPDRKFSLLASTDSYYPSSFERYSKDNKLHVIIPFDNSKIAIAPKKDFNQGLSSEGYNTNFDYFIKTFMQVISFRGYSKKYLGPSDVLYHIVDSDISEVSLRKIAKEYNDLILGKRKLDEDYEDYDTQHEVYKAVKESWERNKDKYKSPFDMFVDGMNPEKNGFKLDKYKGDNREYPGNEIWTSDNCLVIEWHKYFDFVERGIIPK